MTYQEVLNNARTCSGPYCKVCPVCNGRACKNTMPGPGSKGTGTVAARNYDAWQDVLLNMDTICENVPVDTRFTLFGQTYDLPVFAGPVGAVKLHYDDEKHQECGRRHGPFMRFQVSKQSLHPFIPPLSESSAPFFQTACSSPMAASSCCFSNISR